MNANNSGAIIGMGSALPAACSQAQLWEGFFSTHYAGNPVAEKLWHSCQVDIRHGVVDPTSEDISDWSTAARMQRFVDEALPLGGAALQAALEDAGLRPADVGSLTVVSCTGYATPGLDILLARDLGLDGSVQRLHVGHMGCYAALPALASVTDTAAARGKTGLLLCLELSSLHVQPPTEQVDQVVAHALFADAAAAVAVQPRDERNGLEVVDVVARTDVDTAPMMTWDITDMGFRMGLSPEVPAVLERHVADLVHDLLAPHGLTCAQVDAWAVHPGGPRIVDVIAEQLQLRDDDLEVSREILRTVGNCSSATVLLVLERLLSQQRLESGSHVVMLAFGPGLTLYGVLLRQA